MQKRHLEWWEIKQLKDQGCFSADWSLVLIDPSTDLSLVRDVEFCGPVSIGMLDSGKWPGCGLRSLRADNCSFGDGCRVSNIPGGMLNCEVGAGAVVENTARIEFEPEAPCGMGTIVNVLDETGSRPVPIYPGLSAQAAVLMARIPRQAEQIMIPQVEAYAESHPLPSAIGEKAVVRDCGPLINVSVGREVKVEGARSLRNGAIVNNATPGRALAYVGSGVDAENFIIEDGRADSGAIIRNCYIGQGATLEKGFTAHDSLFFANCSLENGEACAVLAGPYTVSMHKSTLLIGCQTSFMNAGSATNQSNHMYKLGPVHWGELERGVKTSSNSYLMLGARIGAFSLLMGDHKTHPDSSEFPFSYLFGDARGATVVVPAMMLRSCGLMRDEKKWPTRDRRVKRKLPLHDRISFEVLNPATVARIIKAIQTIDALMQRPADDDLFLRYKGMKISRASLERGRNLYNIALMKYLSGKLVGKFGDTPLPSMTVEEAEEKSGTWVDLGGQLMPRETMERALHAESVEEREQILSEAFERYSAMEMEWISATIPAEILADRNAIRRGAEEYDRLVEIDRSTYRDELDAEQAMLAL